MNFRTTLFLLVLVAAVGLTLLFTRNKGEKPKETEDTTEHKLLDVDANDVTRIAVTNPDDKRFVLQKTGSSWNLAEPVTAPAKTFEVDSLLRSLTGIQSRGQVDASQKASGGLDHPSYIVELTAKAGKVIKLSFGDKSTLGDSSYVLVGDNAKPDVVGNSVYAQLDKPATTYRETKLVNVSTDQIKQLEITSKGKILKLEKTGDSWQITAPAPMPAETSAVTDVLTGITSLNATEFIDTPGSPSKYSLNRPALTVWFSKETPATQPSANGLLPAGDVLRFGGYQDILKKNVFASLNGNEVAIVPASAEGAFEKTPLELRSKDVANIDPDKVSSIRVAVIRHATTQPTTRAAETHEYTIDRRQIAPVVLGPVLPVTPSPAATQPTEVATTAPSAPTTSASTTQPTTDVATTQPSTQPAEVATTQPANSQPATVAAAPTTEPVSTSKWLFSSGGQGDAEEGQVQALLDSLHPLRAVKYIEPTKSDGDLYTLVIHTIPTKAGAAGEEYAFNFVETGTSVIGTYKDLTFEVDRSLIDKLGGDFKTKKPTATPRPSPSFPGAGGGGAPFGG